MKITILGCGSSGGSPLIGCDCEVCKSDNPKNNRLRSSILVEDKDTRILVDTSPDLRQQALNNNFKTIDAILFTHGHADHTHGLDEVRAFNYHGDKAIDAYADDATFEETIARFPYAFLPKIEKFGWFRPCLVTHEIEHGDVIKVKNMEIQVFKQIHGSAGQTLGFRFGDFAYSTDLNELPEESWEMLKGIKLWIIGCLQRDVAPTHTHLDLALQWVKKVNPQQAILTHMSHAFEYESLLAELPENVMPAYDNMVIEL